MFSPWDSAVLPAHPLHLQLALLHDPLQADRVSMPDLRLELVLVSSPKAFVLTTSTKPPDLNEKSTCQAQKESF